MTENKYRSVFISDVHLGSPRTDTDALAAFLQSLNCEYLFLVGDFVDEFRRKNSEEWENQRKLIFPEIIKHSTNGTKVYYIAGNHENAAWKRTDLYKSLGAIDAGNDFRHTLADGREFIITHGHLYDKFIRYGVLWKISAFVWWRFLGCVNRVYNKRRKRSGKSHRSLTDAFKLSARRVVRYSQIYAGNITRAVEADGVICGHIHEPEIRNVNGMIYGNCGDWVIHNTAIIEDSNGELELYWFDNDNK